MHVLNLILFCVLLGGWNNGPKRYAGTISGKNVTGTVNVKEIMEAHSDYNYGSAKKPNPFVPPLITTLLAKVEVPITSLLQRYPLSTLSLVGIWEIKDGGGRKALVMTPKSEGVAVVVGNNIGQQGGKVTRIYDDRMDVRNFSLAPDGTRQFEDVTLWLGGKPVEEDKKIVIRANRIGRASYFGYGKRGDEKTKDPVDSTVPPAPDAPANVVPEVESTPRTAPEHPASAAPMGEK